MTWFRIALLAVPLCLAVFATPAAAQSRSDAITAIRQQLLFARYDEAIAAAQAFLERTDLDAASRNEGLEVLATAYVANRDTEHANPILEELFRRDPGHVLRDGDASPLVQGAFQRAREHAPDPIAVQLDHTPPAPSVRESPLIELQVFRHPDAVGEIRVIYQAEGSPRFATAVMQLGDNGIASTRLPLVGAGTGEQLIRYYIIAYSPSQVPLATLGSETEPLTVVVPAATQAPANVLDPDPVVDEDEGGSSVWWVALIAVAVVGAAVGGYFLFRPEAPTGSLGHVEL